MKNFHLFIYVAVINNTFIFHHLQSDNLIKYLKIVLRIYYTYSFTNVVVMILLKKKKAVSVDFIIFYKYN